MILNNDNNERNTETLPREASQIIMTMSQWASNPLKAKDFCSWKPTTETSNLGGGFNHFLFSPLFGEDSHFDK